MWTFLRFWILTLTSKHIEGIERFTQYDDIKQEGQMFIVLFSKLDEKHYAKFVEQKNVEKYMIMIDESKDECI
jgi:hypothetical protein